jgi:hypothetical protein
MATEARSTGIGFVGLLQLIFITLKLTGFIDWSWFWVLSPLIFSWSLAILIILIGVVIAIVAVASSK